MGLIEIFRPKNRPGLIELNCTKPGCGFVHHTVGDVTGRKNHVATQTLLELMQVADEHSRDNGHIDFGVGSIFPKRKVKPGEIKFTQFGTITS